jgi:hypothetical protein
MALINTPKTANFDEWRINTNTTASELGDNAALVANTTLSSTNAVSAILEVLAKEQLEVGDVSILTTTATNLSSAVVELDADVGSRASLTTAYKTNLVGAINELDGDIGSRASLTTTSTNNLVSAINELDAEHGTLSTLKTTHKTTLVGSLNESYDLEASRYDNTLKLDLTHDTVGGANTSTQTIQSNLSTVAGKILTINGTLDVSNGSLIVGGAGGTLNIQTTYLVLGDPDADTATSGGIVINRGNVSGTAREDVRVYWDETVKKWSLKKFADDGTTTITPFLIDSYNAKDLIANNTESGISVTWDAANNNFDFDVNDFTITLSGDLSGSATITNLANATLNATIVANSVALGADTTGAYVASIGLAANSGLSVTQSAAGAESNALTNLSVDSTVVRTSGAQTISGIKTFGDKPIFSTGITTSAASDFSGGITVAGDSTFSNNLTVSGNFTVTGTATYVNTETVLLNDNIIVLNNNSATTPTENGGIEIERGNSTNVQLLWNEGNDNWTMSNGTVTYDIAGKVVAGNAITVAQSANKAEWTVNHADTSSVTNVSVDNSGNTFIQDIALTFDTYGHVTGATTSSATVSIGNATLTVVAGNAITLANTSGANTFSANSTTANSITVNHADTSSQASVNNSGYTYIQDITLDTYGHITGINSATWSASLSNITGSTEDIQDIVGAMVAAPNTESGISVTYDDTNGKLDFNVNDPTITISGAVSGSATMNNLGNVTISTTIDTSSTSFSDAVNALLPRIYDVNGTQVFPA